MSWMLDWLACGLVRALGTLLCRLPVGMAVWLGERLGLLGYWLQPGRAWIGVSNVRAAFDGVLPPGRIRLIIRAYFKHMGASVVELLRLPVIDRAYIERHIAIEGRRHFEEALTTGRPVILLTGHYGNWELCSITAALHGYPILALARVQSKFPRLYRLLVSYRESKGCTIVHKGWGVRRLMAALERGRLIGVVGDQASRQGIFVELLGRQALVATGPFELAYRKDALLLPAFIHRVRGPFHRLVIEPPLSPPRQASAAEAVRAAIGQFVEVLSRHVRADPTQWLWLHKRWKHTPSRRILILSDGKAGHLKQSLAVAEALRADRPACSQTVVEVRYRHRWGRLLTLLWSWWMPGGLGGTRCLSLTLAPETKGALLSRYADLIVSCGSSLAPVSLLWAAAHRAKSIVIMSPAPLPLSRFQLVIAPWHDRLPRRSNVVHIAGALVNPLRDEELLQATQRLTAHPNFRSQRSAAAPPRLPAPAHRDPVIAVFIGGETLHHALPPKFAESLIRQVKMVCENSDGWCLVTTSRRTPSPVEHLLAERLGTYPRCLLLLLASRDSINGTMEGMLGSADVAVVTGESISMVSEACASGRAVVVVEPPLRHAHRVSLTKHQRFLRELVKDGYVRLAQLPEVGFAIQRALKEERQPPKRLDTLATVRPALARLLA
jgi:KDO2-lipid IV(A) lauroyltransferase